MHGLIDGLSGFVQENVCGSWTYKIDLCGTAKSSLIDFMCVERFLQSHMVQKEYVAEEPPRTN